MATSCGQNTLIGNGLDCGVNGLNGFIFSPYSHEWTESQAIQKAEYDNKFNLPPDRKLSYIKGDIIEVTNPENTYETLLNGEESKIGETIPKFMVKVANVTPQYRAELSKMFNTGKLGYVMMTNPTALNGWKHPNTGMIMMSKAKLHFVENIGAADNEGDKAGVYIQLINYPFEKNYGVRVLDGVQGSADYYISQDFYASKSIDTIVQDGTAGTTFQVKIQTFEGVPVSGLLQADLLDVTADGVSVLGDVTAFAETTEGSGLYTVTAATPFAAGSYAVTLKAEADLGITGYGFRNAVAGTLT